MNNVILYVEDDESDAFLIKHAFTQADIRHRLTILPDGKSAIDYLSGNGPYADREQHPLPVLTLLDLKMPGLSGLDVLKWIRSTPNVSPLPVVMLTSSNQDSDIHRAYMQGANGYLIKPIKIEEMVTMAKAIKDFWLTQNRMCSWAPANPAATLGIPT